MSNDWHDIEILIPNADDWQDAAYLQLKPYDSDRAMEIASGPAPVRIPLLGSVRNYAAEMVMQNDTWHFLHIGTDLTAAKHMIQALSAQHDVPIRRLGRTRSDVDGY